MLLYCMLPLLSAVPCLTRDPDQLQTTSNEAYNVVRGTGRTVEAVYEIPQNIPPSTSSSSQPTTTAPAGDYETV